MTKAIPHFPTVPAMASYRLTSTFICFNKEHILCYTVHHIQKQQFSSYTAYQTEMMNFYQRVFINGIPF